MTDIQLLYDWSMIDLWLLYDWSTTTLWLIYHYKLQSYDSSVASIFLMPTKDALQDNLSTTANQVSTEDNLLAIAILLDPSHVVVTQKQLSHSRTTRSLKND
jgi:hypothetical protein